MIVLLQSDLVLGPTHFLKSSKWTQQGFNPSKPRPSPPSTSPAAAGPFPSAVSSVRCSSFALASCEPEIHHHLDDDWFLLVLVSNPRLLRWVPSMRGRIWLRSPIKPESLFLSIQIPLGVDLCDTCVTLLTQSNPSIFGSIGFVVFGAQEIDCIVAVPCT